MTSFDPQFLCLGSISLVCAKVGWYVLFLARVVGACVLVCDVSKPIALLLSAIQCTTKGQLLMESVSVSSISPSCKKSKFILSPIPKYGPRFPQSNDNKLRNQVYQTRRLTGSWNNIADCSLDNTLLNHLWPWWIYSVHDIESVNPNKKLPTILHFFLLQKCTNTHNSACSRCDWLLGLNEQDIQEWNWGDWGQATNLYQYTSCNTEQL